MRLIWVAFFATTALTANAQQPLHSLRTIAEVSYFNSNEGLGTGILGLGDINGDGKPDFAVSAINIERTFIYFGGKKSLDSLPDLILLGGGMLGKGDLNGDGRMDLVVATRESLLVYFGKVPTLASPLAIDTVPGLIITGDELNDLGNNSFAIGDLNHDGYDDLVVTNREFNLDRGKVYVYLGRPQPNSTPDFRVVGDTIESWYGTRVGISDINGDGIPDLAVSSNDARGFETIDVYYGRQGWTYTKDGQNQRLDSRDGGLKNLSLFSLVDANADGRADISFGFGPNTFFFYGKPDSVSHIPDLTLALPDSSLYGAFYGRATNIGDINGDGNNDFTLKTNPGGAACLIVYLGGPIPKPVAARCKGFVNSTDAFSMVSSVGDLDGDGINDFGATVPHDALGSPPQDGYLVIFSGDTTLTTSVTTTAEQIPKNATLAQNYPNPFNPQTIIQYSLRKSSHIRILVYDDTGKEVRRLLDKVQEAGNQQVVWDGKSSNGTILSSGAYFYTLIVDGHTIETRKSILLK